MPQIGEGGHYSLSKNHRFVTPNKDMRMKTTLYLEVISSWCFWALPAWSELQKRYAGRVAFDWKIALMDPTGLPTTRAQSEWFYRRSGTIMRSPFMLNAGWFEPGLTEYLAPNLVAEAARDFGVSDDRVWTAIAHAALREGQQVGKWEVAAAIGAQAGKVDKTKLLERARSSDVEARARASTAEFHAMKARSEIARFFLASRRCPRSSPPSTRCSRISRPMNRTPRISARRQFSKRDCA